MVCRGLQLVVFAVFEAACPVAVVGVQAGACSCRAMTKNGRGNWNISDGVTPSGGTL